MNFKELYSAARRLGMDLSTINSLPAKDVMGELELRVLTLFGVDCMLCDSKKSAIPKANGISICNDCDSVAHGELYASKLNIDLDEHVKNKILMKQLSPEEEEE